ncbi:MAG: ArnT family glycosyltransferase, partial [Candidatus Kapaibacterium sp.]
MLSYHTNRTSHKAAVLRNNVISNTSLTDRFLSVPHSGYSRFFQDRSLWVVIAVSSLVLSLLFIEPFSFDNAIYTSIASDLLRQGRILYLGSFDHNFPGIILVHVLAIALFGPSDLGLRLFDFCVQLGFVIFFYKLLSRYLPNRTAALAAILYIFYYVGGGINMYAQRDIYITMCVVAALALLLPESVRESNWRIAASGVWFGIAVLLRPTSLLFVACAGFYLLLGDKARFESRRIPDVLILFVTALLPISVVLLYYAWVPGGLDAFYTCTIRYNLEIYSRMPTMVSFWREFARTAFLPAFAALGLFGNRGRRQPDRPGKRLLSRKGFVFSATLLLSAFLILLLMQKNFRYHFAPVMIGFIPLAAAGIEQMTSRIHGASLRSVVVLALLLLCTFAGYRIQGPIGFISSLWNGTDPFKAVYEVRNDDPQFGAVPEYALRAFLNRPENQHGSIEICSYDPRMRAHLPRTFAGAFVSFQELAPLVTASPDSSVSFTGFQLRWRRKYMQSLETLRPRWIVIARAMTFWAHPVLYPGVLHTMPGFDSLLDTRYDLDTTIG